jgi:hypothetical protein
MAQSGEGGYSARFHRLVDLEISRLWNSRFTPSLPQYTSMAKSKAKRRLQGPDKDHISKKSKTSATITPPPDAAEPTTLRSVGLEEDDLDITIDTLRTLAENPSVIKSKACKDLRTAVYEFRQACTTGFNISSRCVPLPRT